MSVAYRPVQWNRNKVVYDLVLIVCVIGYILAYTQLAPLWRTAERPIDTAIVRMRAYGSCAFLMMTVILSIGPLARLDRRFLPVLYNRRHFGVLTAVVAGAHLSAVLGWYHSFAPVDPWVSLLSSNTAYDSFAGFPFEMLGLFAFAVLLVMAATSHDFWLAFLGPPVWKALHMLLYLAYAAVVMHVALGAWQGRPSLFEYAMVIASVAVVIPLHLAAGLRERRADRDDARRETGDGWLPVAAVANAPADGRALTVALPGGERVAVFRDGARLGAISNLCAHQNGPLGEGRILDGCVTCPWHGFQYRLEDGCAPAPFTEKLSTYRLRIRNGVIEIDPRALPPGTLVPLPTLEGAGG
ncbi:MAG: ferric reductase-like transmembrane domain-containing protein [Alphaproteobacteria bacterium]